MASHSSLSSGLKQPGSSRVRLFAVLMAVSVVLFTFSAATGEAGPIAAVRGVVQTVVMPVRYLGSAIFAPLDGLGNVFTNLTANQETLSQLKEENEQLKAQNAQLAESAQAAQRLEALLELKSSYDLTGVGARVVSGSVDSGSTTIVIDKGTTSGIAVGMPVTDSYGVIGQVSSVGPTTAVVRLVTDERSGVSAMIQSSRAQGQLEGTGGDELSMTLVRADQSVAVGDLVVTSGLGGVYPKGLLLGTVTSVEKPSGALYYDITVRPAATVSSLEEVFVITALGDGQTASADEAAEADSQEEGAAPASTSDTSSRVDGTGSDSGATTSDAASGSSDGTAASGTSSTTTTSGEG